jgi:hypothetical protein
LRKKRTEQYATDKNGDNRNGRYVAAELEFSDDSEKDDTHYKFDAQLVTL